MAGVSAMSAKEAAGVLGVSEKTARRWVLSGRLRADKHGRSFRIPREAIAAIAGQADSPSPDTGQAGLVALVDRLTAENSRPQQDRFELAGRLGFHQARVQQLEETVKALSAPTASNGPEFAQEPTAPAGSTGRAPRPWWRFW
jgi:excisionase family DNA binding protein